MSENEWDPSSPTPPKTPKNSHQNIPPYPQQNTPSNSPQNSQENTPPHFQPQHTPPLQFHYRPPNLTKHNFHIIAHNLHSYHNLNALLDKTPDTHIYLLTELNMPPPATRYVITTARKRGYNVVFARAGINTSGRKTLVRAAVLYPLRILALRQRQETHYAEVTLVTDIPITYATGYALPGDGPEARRIAKYVNEGLQDHPAFFAGDVNITTNHRTFHTPPPWRDVTPLEYNFKRGNARTRPSVALAAREVRVLVAKTLPDVRIGDGHVPLCFEIYGLAWTLSVRRLMRPLSEPSQLGDTTEARLKHTNMQPRDNGAAIWAAAAYLKQRTTAMHNALKPHFGTLGLPKLPDSMKTQKIVRQRLLIFSAPDRHATRWSDWGKHIVAGAVGPPPSAVRTPEGLSCDFEKVAHAHHTFWSAMWQSRVPLPEPDLTHTNALDLDRDLTRRVMRAPYTEQETQDVLAALKTTHSTADFDTTHLKQMGLRAQAGYPSGTRQIAEITTLLNAQDDSDFVVHVLLTAKVPGTIEVPLHRPVGCMPVTRLLRSRINVRRATNLKLPFHSSNFTYRRAYAATDPIVALHAYLTTFLQNESWAVLGADGTKCYDSVPHHLADLLMKAYGLDAEQTLYATKQIFFVLVLAKGTAAAIRIWRGLIQGDPWSCIVMCLLADTLCHWMERDMRIHRLDTIFSQYVDDFFNIVRNHEQANLTKHLITTHWESIGMGASKFRLIRSNFPPVDGFNNDPAEMVLGGCLHPQATACKHAEELHNTAEARIRTIRQLSYCDLTRGLLMDRYVAPLFTHFPCPKMHKTLEAVQILMYDALSRGMPNFHRRFRGLGVGHHVGAAAGGRNIPDLKRLEDETTLRVVRQAISTPSSYRRYVEIAATVPMVHAKQNLFNMFAEVTRRLGITVAQDKRAPPLALYPHQILPPSDMICADASFKGERAVVGIAMRTREHKIHSLTIGLVGRFTSSYEAEAAACAVVSLLHVRAPLVNDNMGVVTHVHRMLRETPALRQRLSLNNQAQPLTLTVASAPPESLLWVKGHVAEATTWEHVLNDAADIASKTEPHAMVEKQKLYTTHYPSYERWGEHVGSLRKQLAEPAANLRRKWGEGLTMSVTEKSMTTLAYFNKKKQYVSMPGHVVNTLMALRMRALVPIRTPRSICACGTPLAWTFAHVVYECRHTDHTTYYAALRHNLLSKYGPGWWLPACREPDAVCACNPLEEYSCTHLTMGFAHSDGTRTLNKTRQILQAWMTFVHARVAISHPANIQCPH